MKSHDEGTWLTYNICQKKFSNSSDLKRHLQRRDGVMTFVCNECQKCFFTSTELKQHQSVHSVVKQFCCGLCGKDFRHKHSFKAHLMRCVRSL